MRLEAPFLGHGVHETLEQALKLASRLEALGYGEQDDNWDDVGQRKDRYSKASTADETQEVSTLMHELRSRVEAVPQRTGAAAESG